MSAKDVFHDAVRNALEKEGWTVTDDPLFIRSLGLDFYIDLAAERIIGVEKEGRKIAVEIKSFTAVILAGPVPGPLGRNISFDGASSFHNDPARQITEYLWDFDDSDGTDPDRPDATGPSAVYAYGKLGDYTVTFYTYDDAGNRESVTYPNGTVARYDYDSLNRLTELRNEKSSGELISGYFYTLKTDGNREV